MLSTADSKHAHANDTFKESWRNTHGTCADMCTKVHTKRFVEFGVQVKSVVLLESLDG